MQLKQTFNIIGRADFVLTDGEGKVKDKWSVDNLITTAGKAYLAAWLAAASQADKFMKYMAIGTGVTPAAVGNTALETECAGGSYARQISTITNATNTFIHAATFGAAVGTGAITECGTLSALTDGTLFSHLVFDPRQKDAADSLAITYTFTIS